MERAGYILFFIAMIVKIVIITFIKQKDFQKAFPILLIMISCQTVLNTTDSMRALKLSDMVELRSFLDIKPLQMLAAAGKGMCCAIIPD